MRIINITGRVSKDRLESLGRLCVHWSILETRIEYLIWAIRGLPRKAGRKITSDMQLQPRLKELKKTARKHLTKQEDIKTIDGYVVLIRKLAKSRNWFVHGLWGHGTAKGEKRKVFVASYYQRHNGGSHEASVQIVNGLTGQVTLTINTIDNFITKRLGVPLP